MLGGASLAAPLDAEPEIVEGLVEVDDPGLVLGQAQTHGGQRAGELIAQRLGVFAGPRDHGDEIIRIADQPPIRKPAATPRRASRARDHRHLPGLHEVIVEHRQGDVGEHG